MIQGQGVELEQSCFYTKTKRSLVCKDYSSVASMYDPVILLGSYICYTTNTLDTVEAFIAETYVQLVITCYSSRCSTLTGVC